MDPTYLIWINQRWGTTNLGVGSVLAIVAGLLMLVEAAFVLPGSFVGLYALGAGAGLFLIGGGVALQAWPRYRQPLGAVFMVLSLLSLVGDSGYYLGSVLGLVGGVLVLTSRDVRFQNPMTHTVFSTHSLGNPCGRCGRPVPSWTGTCPYCGFPER